MIMLTSQQEFAIWQPAWPTKNHHNRQYKVFVEHLKIVERCAAARQKKAYR
jgi:hypothetical protein